MCGSPSMGHKVLGRRLNRAQGREPRTEVGIATTIKRCNSCGLIYCDPLPIPLDLQDHYGVPPEEYWKEEYFTLHDGYLKEELSVAKLLLPARGQQRSLDVGAGIGKSMLAMAGAGFDAHGFEPSKPFYERAIKRMGIRPERLQLGRIEEVQYPSDHFDLISFGAVLEHLYDPSTAIVKAMGWLKPGGVVHVEVPSAHWLVNRILNLYYRLRGTDFVANLSPMHEPFHLYEFTLRAFQLHAQQHGYQIALHRFYVCQTFMPRILGAMLKPIMLRTDTGMQLSIWLRKPEVSH